MSEDENKKLDEIKILLSGNPWDKSDDGLMGFVQDLNTRIFNLEKLVWRFVWMGAGICGLGTLLFSIATIYIAITKK